MRWYVAPQVEPAAATAAQQRSYEHLLIAMKNSFCLTATQHCMIFMSSIAEGVAIISNHHRYLTYDSLKGCCMSGGYGRMGIIMGTSALDSPAAVEERLRGDQQQPVKQQQPA